MLFLTAALNVLALIMSCLALPQPGVVIHEQLHDIPEGWIQVG